MADFARVLPALGCVRETGNFIYFFEEQILESEFVVLGYTALHVYFVAGFFCRQTRTRVLAP